MRLSGEGWAAILTLLVASFEKSWQRNRQHMGK